MRGRFTAVSIAIAGALLLALPATAQQTRVLPQVKALHLRLFPPAANVPAACRVFAGVLGGQFPDGPYANLVMMSVAPGPKGCVFHGIYGWSAYAGDPTPGTTDVGPSTYLDAAMVGHDLKLGDPANAALVIHPNLTAEFYMKGKLVSHAALERIPAGELN